jgi:hypothetical protein
VNREPLDPPCSESASWWIQLSLATDAEFERQRAEFEKWFAVPHNRRELHKISALMDRLRLLPSV